MQALKLSKKYPEFKQDEIFDLINKFQYVHLSDMRLRAERSTWMIEDLWTKRKSSRRYSPPEMRTMTRCGHLLECG